MDTRARRLRTVLATAVAMPAVILASAGTAHATARGLDVNFEPLLGGIGVRVEVVDTVGAGKQNCTYDSKSEGASLLPPFHKDFVLGVDGVVSWQIPGIATGTLWRVHIACTFDPPNQFAKPGLFDDTVTY